jgi:[ribosomal protein S5]-alanine N-acetyltransferase
MTPRLVGPRVALVPATAEIGRAVLSGADPAGPLAAVGLRPGSGWPTADSADALAGPAQADGPVATWLVAVDGVAVGECGWKGPPDDDGAVEIGYGLTPAARGDGLGTEAVAVLLAWTERQPGVRGVVAETLVGNEPSRRLLRRLGFTETSVDGRVVRAARGRVAVRGRHVC